MSTGVSMIDFAGGEATIRETQVSKSARLLLFPPTREAGARNIP
jgi:hypothetical protein